MRRAEPAGKDTMQADMRNNGTAAVLRPEGAVHAAAVDRLREEWQTWFKQSPDVKLIVVDLSAVDFIDSSGLGLLVALLKWEAARGGDVRLAGLRPAVRMIFDITRTYKVFSIHDHPENALTDNP